MVELNMVKEVLYPNDLLCSVNLTQWKMICYTLLYKYCIALVYTQDTQVNTSVMPPLYNICIDTIYMAMYNGMYTGVMQVCILRV